MSVNLTASLERLAQQLNSTALARTGADAGVEVMRQATAGYLGGKLSMSGLVGGEAEFDTSRTRPSHVSIIGVGGTFALADHGRQRRVEAHARRGSALNTPWGPRASAAGSTWAGFGITDRHGSEALQAAADAIVDDIVWG